MITQTQVREHGRQIDDLSTLAVNDVIGLMALMDLANPVQTRNTLIAALPDIVDPYAQASADIGATFYEQTRASAGAVGLYEARPAALPNHRQYESLARWGVGPLFKQSLKAGAVDLFQEAAAEVAVSLISGGVQKLVASMDRETIAGNGRDDTQVLVGYQRVPNPACCAFCGMLASRGAAYQTEGTARIVRGRGVPLAKTKGRAGGQGRGIKARGVKEIGEEYHDWCRCVAVPVFESSWVEMQEDADAYLDSYLYASGQVNKDLVLVSGERSRDGARRSKSYWQHKGKRTTPESRTRMIVAAMREDLGVK